MKNRRRRGQHGFFDILDLILDPILDLFVLKMPKKIFLKRLLLNILGLACLTAAVIGWLAEILLLVIPAVCGVIWFFWRAHRVYTDWLSER